MRLASAIRARGSPRRAPSARTYVPPYGLILFRGMSAQAPTGAPRGAERSTRPLRVAVVGLGLIGRQRAEALARIDGAELAATVNPFRAGLDAQGTGAAGAVPHHATPDELATDSFDAAVVAVPHDQAGPLAQRLLARGKPLLIEKPLGLSAAEARRLETLAAGLRTPSFVGYNYRFLPAIAELLARARAGELGELRSVDLLVGHGGHPDSARGWKLDPARAGGGVLLDPGVHLLDLLLALAPHARCTRIEATRGFWGTGIEEDVVATFRAGQLIATVRVSHVRWVNTFRAEVFGESAYALGEGRGGNYGAMTLRVGRRWGWTELGVVSQRASERVYEYGEGNDSLRDELAAVIACWRDERVGGARSASADPQPQPQPRPPAGARSPAADPRPQPATMSEARRVTELCEQLYLQIGGRDGPTAS